MAETADLFVIDGEDAGANPWEFDSITKQGSCDFSLQASAKHAGSNGYMMQGDGVNNLIRGNKTLVDEQDFYSRVYVKIPSGIADTVGGPMSLYLPLLAAWDGSDAIFSIGLRFQTNDAQGWYVHNIYEDVYNHIATNYSEDAWHYLEMRNFLDGVDGHFTAKIDGTQVHDFAPGDLSFFAVDKMTLGSFSHTGGNAILGNGDQIFFDDFLGDTNGWIGSYSGGGIRSYKKAIMVARNLILARR